MAVDISNLSRKRDRHSLVPQEPIHSDQDLLDFVNHINESWMSAAQRISTPLLIDLLQFVGQQVNTFFATVDPFAMGEPVSWVGPESAPHWLDLAREYTERWHHQQHIRDAVGVPGLKESRFFAPIMDAFVRALPYTYRDVQAPENTIIRLQITGDSGGIWSLRKEGQQWALYTGSGGSPNVQVAIHQEDAWRLFTKGIDPNQVRARAEVTGSKTLGSRIFQMVSIIA